METKYIVIGLLVLAARAIIFWLRKKQKNRGELMANGQYEDRTTPVSADALRDFQPHSRKPASSGNPWANYDQWPKS
jgi:hypothetical protein